MQAPDDERQAAYAARRRWYTEAWFTADAEDFCARKEVEPGTYKPLE